MTAKNSTATSEGYLVHKGKEYAVIYKGKEYASISSFCLAFDANRNTVGCRLTRGATPEESLNPDRNISPIWNKQKCIDLSSQCNNTREFRVISRSAWRAVLKHGWLDSLLCDHVEVAKHKPKGYWTKDRVREVALEYTHLADMERGNRSAYNAARKMGITKEINAHMIWQLRSDHDTLYILKTDQQIAGLNVYKCGVTSWRLGTNRFKRLSLASGFRYTPLFHKRINGNAIPTEQAILSIGRNPQYDAFDGSTEHRQWTDGELENAMMMARNAVMQFNDVKRDEPRPLTEQLGLWG